MSRNRHSVPVNMASKEFSTDKFKNTLHDFHLLLKFVFLRTRKLETSTCYLGHLYYAMSEVEHYIASEFDTKYPELLVAYKALWG